MLLSACLGACLLLFACCADLANHHDGICDYCDAAAVARSGKYEVCLQHAFEMLAPLE